jgi:hypothetical protein
MVAERAGGGGGAGDAEAVGPGFRTPALSFPALNGEPAARSRGERLDIQVGAAGRIGGRLVRFVAGGPDDASTAQTLRNHGH